MAGDIVLCNFYFSDAKRSKNRPVLVLKDNLPFDDFVAIPIIVIAGIEGTKI